MGCGGFRAGGVPKALVDGKQDANALLTAIAGLAPTVADRMIYTTGVNAVNTTTLTSAARSLLDDSSADEMRSTLGLGSANTPTFAGLNVYDGSAATPAVRVGLAIKGGLYLYDTNMLGVSVHETAVAAFTTGSFIPQGTKNLGVSSARWNKGWFGSGGIDVSGDIDASGTIEAGLLSRTPILPPWDDSANPTLTAADTGGTFKFTGTATLPDASTLPEGWTVTLIFAAANAMATTAAGNIISPDGNFGCTAIFENGSGRAALRLICDGSDYIAASQTGALQNV